MAIACILLSHGCSDSRPGVLLTQEGKLSADTAPNRRDNAVATIERDLQADLGPHWKPTARIAELPVWKDDRDDGDWRWSILTAVVDLAGDGQVPLKTSEDEIRAAVMRYLTPHVDHAAENLHVTVTRSTVAAPAAAVSEAPVAVIKVPDARAPGASRSYIVQPGDTIADISIAFYGTAEHWRAIIDANPGLDPSALKPGASVIIPPR